MEANQTPSMASTLGFAIFISVTGFVLLVIVAVVMWWNMLQLALLYFALVPAATGLAVYLSHGDVRQSAVGFLVALIMGGLTYTWTVPEVRAQSIRLAGGTMNPETLFTALEDPAEVVGFAACDVLMAQHLELMRVRVPDFASTPARALRCFDREVESSDADEILRREVALFWSKQLADGGDAECTYLPAFAKFRERDSTTLAADLLGVMTRSQDASTQECALGEFKSRFPTPLKQLEGLGDPRKLAERDADALFLSLTNASYNAVPDKTTQAVTTTPLMKQWGLSLGCYLVDAGPSPSRYVQRLNSMMRMEGCGEIDVPEASSLWSSACSESLSGTHGLVTQSRLCRAVGNQAIGLSIRGASTVVGSAIEALATSELATGIRTGDHRSKSDIMDQILAEGLGPDAEAGIAMKFGYEFESKRFQMRQALREVDGKDPEKMNDLERERFMKELAESGEFEGVNLKEALGEEGFEAMMKEVGTDDGEVGSMTVNELIGR
jgi:hypothetical protein